MASTSPIQTQTFSAFLGTQEGMHSIILPDVFSPGGSMNLYLDKFGRAKKISGYTKQNTAAVTTNGGGSACRVRGLFPYRKTAGGSITRQLVGVFDDAVNEWEVWTSTDSGANWTFRLDLGAGSIGLTPDFAQFGDDLFITNGAIAPRVWNGTSIASAGGTQSPTPSAAASAEAGVLNGPYKYKLVSRMTDGTRKDGSVASTELRVAAKKVDLTWTADADVLVVGYELYRTTGTGSTYYFVTYIDARLTAAYTDNTLDITIVGNRSLEEHGDAPPTCYFCEPHKQRMWWLRTDTSPTRAYWSDAGNADSVYGSNFLDFSDSGVQGDVITGAIGNFNDALVVFTERAIWSVSGTGAVIGGVQDWTRRRTNSHIGSVTHRSAIIVPAGAKYIDQLGTTQTTSEAMIAFFSPLGDICLFDGDNSTIISDPVKDTLATINYAQRTKIHVVHDSQAHHYIWFIPTGSSSEPNKAIVWNYRWGVWYIWSPIPASASCEVETSSDPSLLLIGESSLTAGGFIYALGSGDSFNGTAIQTSWMTKTIRGLTPIQGDPDIPHTKRWRWVDLLFQTTTSSPITVEWLEGLAGDTASATAQKIVNPASEAILTSDGVTIYTATSADQVMIQAATTLIRVMLKDSNGNYIHDTGIRLRIGDNASNGSWSLEGFTVGFQTLEGLKRRSQ